MNHDHDNVLVHPKNTKNNDTKCYINKKEWNCEKKKLNEKELRKYFSE